MILVTAAAGSSGGAVVRALVRAGADVRASVHGDSSADRVRDLGAVDVVVGDLLDPAVSAAAVDGVAAVVHIGPPFHPRETDIGHTVLAASRHAGVGHFVQMSCFHSQIEALLNHQAKLALERLVIVSRLPFTILQPMHFMQNNDVRQVADSGRFSLPYSLDSPISHVDLEDVAEVAAAVAGDPQHHWATYQLCGDDSLTGHDIARTIGEVSGRQIETEQTDAWVADPGPRQEETDDFALDSLRRLFDHYGRYGFQGNSRVLTWLLGRAPTSFRTYVERSLNATSGSTPASGVFQNLS